MSRHPVASFALKPLVFSLLVAGALAATATPPAHAAPRAFGSAWFAAKGTVQANTVATGKLPNGVIAGFPAAVQRDQANATLQRSVANLGRVASAIAAQQAAQNAAREAARLGLDHAPLVREGMARGDGRVLGGLVAGDHLQSWTGTARTPKIDPATGQPLHDAQGKVIEEVAAPVLNVGKSVNGHHWVDVRQTGNKAILNWETFNVGRNTTLNFDQATYDAAGNRTAQRDWAVLNKVVGANVAPSQIQGAIRADGTVMVVNQNGVVFSGSSQVNVRNLVAAAAEIKDDQFGKGLYVDTNGTQASFTHAAGDVQVKPGAQIRLHDPASNAVSGGYVLLLGQEVHNAGQIATPSGQAVLAAGDRFYIRKGVSTAGNAKSTTRGNEVAAHIDAGSATTGLVSNTGLIVATAGDITMTGRDVRQAAVAVATSSPAVRGTIHLATQADDDAGRVVLGGADGVAGSGATAIVLETPQWLDNAVRIGSLTQDQGRDVTRLLGLDEAGMGLDNQRQAALERLDGVDNPLAAGNFRNLSKVADFTDLSRVEIVSGGTVQFQDGSLTLATGGQVVVDAARRARMEAGSQIDVAGAVGVRVAMEANNLKINVQGNELRDAPVNRDSDPANRRSKLSNLDVWLDRRLLVPIAAGTNGYDDARWYTAGGLLEVGGYLGMEGRSVGEWMAQGGTVRFSGADVVTQAHSAVNLSGGTLDVQDGYLRQSWLRGVDGRLYMVDRAPGDLQYRGVYRGYEQTSERWGHTRAFYNPLLAPKQRFESGYTVGRDAGKLIVSTANAVLEGGIVGATYQGAHQLQKADLDLDGWFPLQTVRAQGAQLVVGSYVPYYVKNSGRLRYRLMAEMDAIRDVVLGASAGQEGRMQDLSLDADVPSQQQGRLLLDTAQLSQSGLGALRIAAGGSIVVEEGLTLDDGGEITLYSPDVRVEADLISHGGTIRLGNVLNQVNDTLQVEDTRLPAPSGTTAGVVVAEGARLDTSGLWSNLLLAPKQVANLPWLDGGQVSVRTSGDVTLAQGSVIDVSSGAVLWADGSLGGGKGGSVTLAVNVQSDAFDGKLRRDGELRALGVKGGGTLALQAGQVTIGGDRQNADAGLWLDTALFRQGFSQYQVTGLQGVTVADGTQLDVYMPVYRMDDATATATTGTPVYDALSPWTLPVYVEDRGAGKLTQRQGASLALHAGGAATGAAAGQVQLSIGHGASVSVDPAQSIALRSAGQLTVEGTLNAWGGRITLGDLPAAESLVKPSGLSVWIGERAVLDVAGRAWTHRDTDGRVVSARQAGDALRTHDGRRYGQVQAGGEIVVGDMPAEGTGERTAMNRFIVIREGARLDASGAQSELDIVGQGATVVASDGGAITLASDNGLYLDGLLLARAGGAHAAGGSLWLQGNGNSYALDSTPQDQRQVRELVVGQRHVASALPAGLDAAAAAGQLAYGHARLGVDQIEAGGFDTLTLASGGMIAFEAGVDLALGRTLNLYAGALGLADGSAEGAEVRLSAPYVRLSGVPQRTEVRDAHWLVMNYGINATPSQQAATGRLTLDAGRLLELADVVGFGGRLTIPGIGGAQDLTVDRRAFDQVRLGSGGDLRFLGASHASGTQLYMPGDLTLAAAQIYPMTHANATVNVGWGGQYAEFDAKRKLIIERTTDGTPATPYSIFGTLTLLASTIEQGGVLRAPLGVLNLGIEHSSTQSASRIHLREKSLSSVSAAGLMMPYGGTSDGVNWMHDGAPVALLGAGSTAGGSIKLTGQRVEVQEGAVIDLSGGGTLTGAGFVSGRGGSTDARYHPLVRVGRDGFVLPELAGNPVYALVPGSQALVAPAGGETGAVDPALGRQITIGAGVPGLDAGIYTLLPSTYALLPGAFRVEFNGMAGQGAAMPAQALRNGSWSASGILSVAGTHIQDKLSQPLILTPADVLRTYSQYNETSYADFARADAARLGIPRAQIEADAKLLQLRLQQRDDTDVLSLRFAGAIMGKAAAGGHGSTLAVTAPRDRIEILADTTMPAPDFQVALRAADLNGLDVNRLVIGALPRVSYGKGGNLMQVNNERENTPATGITMRSGARLAAPEVMLATYWQRYLGEGTIDIEQGAAIETLGKGGGSLRFG